MANNYFQFKQFTIWQHKCAMKVGTDGVLLGAWCNAVNPKRILDIGSGSGLITLMLAQRFVALIDAVEIEPNAFEQCAENINASIWKNRIESHNCPIQEFKTNDNYDLIVSNPPFFGNSLPPETKERSIARHSDALNYEDLFNSVNSLLTEQGVFSVIVPFDNSNALIQNFITAGYFVIRKCLVYPTPSSIAKRIMLEFSKIKKDCEEQSLVIESNGRHQYSEEYKQLTKDFYLNF